MGLKGEEPSTQVVASNDLPIECLIRILSFAGHLGILDTLSREFAALALSKRLRHPALYLYYYSTTLPRTPCEMAVQTGWAGPGRVPEMLKEVAEMFDIFDHSLTTHILNADKRQKEILFQSSLYPRIHVPQQLRRHTKRAREYFTMIPPSLAESALDFKGWNDALVKHREGLFSRWVPPTERWSSMRAYAFRMLGAKVLTNEARLAFVLAY